MRGRPFIVFHDAYQYFEHRFDLPGRRQRRAAGGCRAERRAGGDAARPGRDEGIVCAFAEPQFEPRLLATVIEGTDVRTGVLDPLGAALPPGPSLYPALLLGLADSLVDCLGR